MEKKINITAVSAFLMLLISLGIWFAIPYCIDEMPSAVDLGPRAFPRLISGAIALLSVLQLVLLVTGAQKGICRVIRFNSQKKVFAAMVISLMGVICSLTVNIVAAGVICSILFLALLRIKDRRYYLAVISAGVILYMLMRFVMHIRF